MPVGKSRSRKKVKGQEKDVSFRFHSGGDSETGAYLSEGKQDNPLFSDVVDEHDEPVNEDGTLSGYKGSSGGEQVMDQKFVSELIESAIDDTSTDTADHPVSDQLFEFDQDPLIHQCLGKSEVIEEDRTKELEYNETLPEDDQQSKKNNLLFSDVDEQEESLKEDRTLANCKGSNSGALCEADQELVSELIKSAIDNTNIDTADRPISDQLFAFDKDPLIHQYCGKSNVIEEDGTKYKETSPENDQQMSGFSDSGDFMDDKETEGQATLWPSENHKLLSSDDEDLFFPSKAAASSVGNEVSDVTTELRYVSHELDSDNDDTPVAVRYDNGSPFKDSTSCTNTSDAEDVTALSQVDTHPLVPTCLMEGEEEEDGGAMDPMPRKDDNHDRQLLVVSEGHFSATPELEKRQHKGSKIGSKGTRPPRPPPPYKTKKPSIIVSSPIGTEEKANSSVLSRGKADRTDHDSDNVVIKQEIFPDKHSNAIPTAVSCDNHSTVRVDTHNGDQIPSESVEDESLSLPYFMAYVLILFLYYSLNPSSYLAGFLTGFFFFFVSTAAGFIYYASYLQTLQQRDREAVQKSMELSSQQFLDKLGVNFEQLSIMKHDKFGVRFDYDKATHHYSDSIPCRIKLQNSILTLSIKKSSDYSQTVAHQTEIIRNFELLGGSVTLEPEEIAENRKRRWSKKFPICVRTKGRKEIFLFSPTAKLKEMWFRHMRSSADGISVESVIAEQKKFFSYMEQYLPRSTGDSEGQKHGRQKKQKPDDSFVSFSTKSYEEATEEGDSKVSINKQSKAATASAAVKKGGAKTPIPPTVAADMDWLNTALARVCWDIWHEKHWHDWVVSRIQRRISRIKTPSWMEPLSVTDVQLGESIPTVKRVYATPKLDLEGVWIYLAVKYRGSFTMTLETKLRLGKGPKDETDSQQQPYVISSQPLPDPKRRLERQTKTQSQGRLAGVQESPEDVDSNHSGSLENSVEGDSTFVYKQSMPRSISSSLSLSSSFQRSVRMAGDSDSDSSSDDDTSASSSLGSSPSINQIIPDINSSASATSTYPSKPGKWRNMFDRFKNSAIVQKAANTNVVRRAAEKMFGRNLYLTVEVRALDGFLAVNMSPPPSDILWYGFQWKPRLDLSAKPKLGQREVTIHYITDWIENKLKELLEKQMVLPNMESIAIPILKSVIPGDVPHKLSTPK